MSRLVTTLFFLLAVAAMPVMASSVMVKSDAGKKEVVLTRCKSLEKQLTEPNVTYVVKRKHNLKGKEVSLPQGCCLKFKGGRIFNGKLVGAETIIENRNENSFEQLTFAGVWKPAVVSPEWFGAKGDGVTDDTRAIQKAADFAAESVLRFTAGRRYKYTKGISIKGNTTVEGYGSTIVKACYSAFLHNEHNNEDIVDENISIKGLTGITLNDSYRGLWLWMVGVKGLEIADCSFSNHTPIDKDQHSQWCVTISGEDMEVRSCRIDNSGGGLFSDGIHVYNATNCSIHDCTIITEDDCIGFAPEIPKEQVEYRKFNQISRNIRIYDNRLSGNRNCIRFEVRENAPKVYAYQNVTVSNNTLVGTPTPVSSFLYLHDYRKQTAVLNSSFVVDGLKVEGRLIGEGRNFIEVFGKNPVTQPQNVVNIKDVSISNISVNLSGYENFVRCIGASKVRLSGCSFLATDKSDSHIAIRDCDEVEIEGCDFTTYTQYPFIQATNSSGTLKSNRIERLSTEKDAGIGIYLEASEKMEVKENEISNFSIGFRDGRQGKRTDTNRYDRCRQNIQKK